jgi:peroxiredoxin
MKDLIRLGIVVVVLAAGAAGFVWLQQHKGYALKVGEPAPAFELKTLDGTTTSLASLRGRVVLLNLWASWCPPCLQEMPSLEQLHQKMKGEGLVIVGVSVDEQPKAIRDVIAKTPVTFMILHDPESATAAAYRTTGYPETFLIDRDGVLRETFVGPKEWETPAITEAIRSLLAPS